MPLVMLGDVALVRPERGAHSPRATRRPDSWAHSAAMCECRGSGRGYPLRCVLLTFLQSWGTDSKGRKTSGAAELNPPAPSGTAQACCCPDDG